MESVNQQMFHDDLDFMKSFVAAGDFHKKKRAVPMSLFNVIIEKKIYSKT